MTTALLSTARLSLLRYARSKGLWILMLTGLLGARFWIPREDHSSVIIAVNNHLPVITSPMIGMSLGIVLTTLLLPFGYIYLRSNINRRQPWQVAEVTSASRIALSLGHFAADAAVMAALLAVMTLAGWIVALLALPFRQVHLWQIAAPLWLSAAPALLGLAAVYRLFESLSFTRRAWGDVFFFVFWISTLVLPLGGAGRNTFTAHMHDLSGTLQALSVLTGGLQSTQISIGPAPGVSGQILLQPLSVVLTGPYITARLTWCLLSVLLAALAGVLYQPHVAIRKSTKTSRWSRWAAQGPPPAAIVPTIIAQRSSSTLYGLLLSELRLVFRSRPTRLLCFLIAAAGVLLEYRHFVSPVIFLLLVFGTTSQAAREEAKGMLALTRTMVTPSWLRRTSLIAAGVAGAVLLSLPAILIHHDVRTLLLALEIGAGVSLFAVALTSITRSAFAARLLLLLAWYGYIST